MSSILVLDIGDDVTSFTLDDVSIEAGVGAALLTRHELHSDPPRPEELLNAIGTVLDHLDDVLLAEPALADVTTAIASGNVAAVTAAVEVGVMDNAQLHGLCLPRDTVEEVFRTLATEPLADRVHNPGLPAADASTIVGGLCVLVGVMRRLHLAEITVSIDGART